MYSINAIWTYYMYCYVTYGMGYVPSVQFTAQNHISGSRSSVYFSFYERYEYKHTTNIEMDLRELWP